MADAYTEYLNQLMGANPPAGQASPTLYAPARTALEQQYGVAKDQLLSTMPRGGQLNSALANLILQRAQGVGSLTGNLFNQTQGRAMQMAPLMANMYQYDRNRNAQNWGALGSGLGILAGLALGSQE